MILDGYPAALAEFFVLTRRDGILEARMRSGDGPAIFSRGLLHAWGELWRAVGSDHDTEVLILTGTGDHWIGGFDLSSLGTPLAQWPSDEVHQQLDDGLAALHRLVFEVEVPTIAAINGPGPRLETALLCDVTLCADDVRFGDGNFLAGSVPGDGMNLVLQELVGIKRAAHLAYTGAKLDAATALAEGLVSEVLPRDELLPRAWSIARGVLAQPRTARRLTHAVLQRPWRRRLLADQAVGYSHQLLAGR